MNTFWNIILPYISSLAGTDTFCIHTPKTWYSEHDSFTKLSLDKEKNIKKGAGVHSLNQGSLNQGLLNRVSGVLKF